MTHNRSAIITTSKGDITIELYEDKMPITTANFIKLASQGFYDATRFHRVIGPLRAPPHGFMIQGGDPLSKNGEKQRQWGTGGPGYSIKDEFHRDLHNTIGTIAMANSGPNSGGSQFFINIASNTFLDSKHPVFGKVIAGMDTVNAIAKVRTDTSDKPIEDVLLVRVNIK